ncbi:MAG: glycosyl hydrolase 2 galactose-binding domain-containing protein, partial [Eubacteriales bacterium]
MDHWKVAYAEHNACKNLDFFTIEQIENAGLRIIPASVPGELQLDMMRQGIIDDLFYSDNALTAQRLENLHAWYYTRFDTKKDMHLKFYGIDTVADIYLNGKMVKSVSNMFLEYEIFEPLKEKDNELIVHIKPVCIEARKFELPASCISLAAYNYPAFYMRKAAHSYGWDIMPRIVTSGIWKPVELVKIKKNQIKNVFLSTSLIDGTDATLTFCITTEVEGDFIQDYSVHVTGVCEDSRFEVEKTLYHTDYRFELFVENCKLWFPRFKGKPNLYRVKAELLFRGEPVDSYEFRSGIRTVRLERTDVAGINGEFCFYINGVKTFITGTNWVPLDAFHSRDEQRMEKAL